MYPDRLRRGAAWATRPAAGFVICGLLPALLHAGDLSPARDAPNAALNLDDAAGWAVRGGSLEQTPQGLRIRIDGPSLYMERVLQDVQGPAALEFEMQARAGGNDPYLTWCTDGDRSWRQFVRIPIEFSNHWRSYSLPLTTEDPLIALRLSLTGEGSELMLRNARLRPLAIERAETPAQEIAVRNGPLRLTYHTEIRSYRVADTRTSRVWRSDALPGWLTVTRVDTSHDTIALHLYNAFTQQSATLHASVMPDASLRFRLNSSNPDDAISGMQHLPPVFTTELEAASVVFCDRSCGVLLDQRDSTYAKWPLRVYGNTHCLDMPWMGVFDERSGDGVMLLIDTPADAEVSLLPDTEGKHWPRARWLPSMDTVGYERTCSLHFTKGGGYVALAKRYRQTLSDGGRLRTLAEKAQGKPQLERIRGAPLLWVGRDAQTQVQLARSQGVLRGVVSNCMKRSQVEWLIKMGYLVGRYDSYTDIFEGPVDFQRDNIADTAVRARPGHTPLDGWRFEDGRQMAWRSSAFWMPAAKHYVPRHLAKSGHNARFVDVAVAATPMEDWAPGHTFDRRRDLEQRRELFNYLNELKLVLGTEHGNDWAADLVDYHEGSLSGPFWWSSWEAGHLKSPTREQLSSDYLKYGMGFAHRVPLWQLVYHDCLVSSWYWGDNAGMLHHAAPELADRKDLFTLLYGSTPLLWMEGRGYGWPENQQRWLKTHHDTCKFFEEVAFSELLDHQFLSEDKALQRCTFAGGGSVTVNFSSEPRSAPGSDDPPLAPLGYLATAPGFSQERLWIDGQALTTIKKDGWLTLESEKPTQRHGVEAAGRVTLFDFAPGQWRLIGKPDRQYRVRVDAVTGWSDGDRYELRAVEPDGTMGPVISENRAGAPLAIETSSTTWQYALVRRTSSTTDDAHAALERGSDK